MKNRDLEGKKKGGEREQYMQGDSTTKKGKKDLKSLSLVFDKRDHWFGSSDTVDTWHMGGSLGEGGGSLQHHLEGRSARNPLFCC